MRKSKHHKEKFFWQPAFTMIEMIMVMVVIGILAAVAIPRLDRDIRQEAADNIISAIRHTRLMALTDDVTDPRNNKWQQKFWRIYFGTCNGKAFYAVGTDDSTDSSTNARVDITESSIDPANGKYLWAHDGATCEGSHNLKDLSPSIFIGKKYGVTLDNPSGGCSNKYIGFDHMGRPYNSAFPASTTPDYSGTITSDCNLTFKFSNSSIDDVSIIIEKQTGHAYIDD